MKKFIFGGMGNYSQSFGWDTGLSCKIHREEGFSMPDVSHMGTFGQEQELRPFKEGVHIENSAEYGGTRAVIGYIIAFSKEDAEKYMQEYSNEFPVIKYRGQ